MVAMTCSSLSAQSKFVANYDEAKIPPYTLPDPLVTEVGPAGDRRGHVEQGAPSRVAGTVHHAGLWSSPGAVRNFLRSWSAARTRHWEGKAIRREIDVFFGRTTAPQSMRLLVYTRKAPSKAPAFLGLNFQGNHTRRSRSDHQPE